MLELKNDGFNHPHLTNQSVHNKMSCIQLDNKITKLKLGICRIYKNSIIQKYFHILNSFISQQHKLNLYLNNTVLLMTSSIFFHLRVPFSINEVNVIHVLFTLFGHNNKLTTSILTFTSYNVCYFQRIYVSSMKRLTLLSICYMFISIYEKRHIYIFVCTFKSIVTSVKYSFKSSIIIKTLTESNV